MGANRQIVLASRPTGAVNAAHFALRESPMPEPAEGQVLLRNLYLSMDPAIRGWMAAGESYIDPIPIGAPIRSGAIGEVVASEHPDYAPGDRVVGLMAWEDFSAVSARQLGRVLPRESPLPLSTCLSVLGGNGLTAYFGLLEVGRPQPGETVVVSAAAGGVGSIVGQIARIRGCRAVGIAGREDKCRWLTEELGFDAAVNYREQPGHDVSRALKAVCPKGVDVYFDNVGGPILDAVLRRINVGARVVLCGAISQINATELPPGPSNYIRLLTRRARMEGFVTLDYAARWAEGSAQLARWVLEGELRYRDEIVEGLERAPQAFLRLFSGDHIGKLMVRVAPE